MTTSAEHVLVAGSWRPAAAAGTYQAVDPSSGLDRPAIWPVSGWSDVDEALDAAVSAAAELARLPGDALGGFLDRYAARLEAR
ncbi:MAG: aldehyde dehydrogenase (NADP(+)), partial [Planctomycetota bacterium]